jgi:hypothetical protein
MKRIELERGDERQVVVQHRRIHPRTVLGIARRILSHALTSRRERARSEVFAVLARQAKGEPSGVVRSLHASIGSDRPGLYERWPGYSPRIIVGQNLAPIGHPEIRVMRVIRSAVGHYARDVRACLGQALEAHFDVLLQLLVETRQIITRE